MTMSPLSIDLVANRASELFQEAFGARGAHARNEFGVGRTPGVDAAGMFSETDVDPRGFTVGHWLYAAGAFSEELPDV